MRSTWTKFAVAASVLLTGSAFAALPSGSISYLEPTGTVGPNETIYVALRFTLAPGSAPISYTDGGLLGSLDPVDLPAMGEYSADGINEMRAFASYSFATLSAYFMCDDTFSGGCNGNTANYKYSFNSESVTGRRDVSPSSLMLQPGESFEYVFAYFTPAAGGAAPGIYTYSSTGVTIQFYGADADGNSLFASVDIATNFGETFTRTVTAVPEPETWALLGAGFAFVGAVARRRRQG